MFDENRPKFKLEKTSIDLFVEYTTFGLLSFSVFYTMYYYGSLPEQVPMHFNYSGKVSRYGSKDSIWALHFIGIATVFALYFLNKSPHIFNYPQKITSENAKKQYTDATKLMRYLNLGIAILFTTIGYEIIQIALGNTARFSKTSNFVIIGIVATMTLFPFVYLIKNFRKKK